MPAADTAPVRPGEDLDARALFLYLKDRVEGVGDGLVVEQFPGGHSNLTYLLQTPEREYVLRRAPLGPVPPKAHDMAREYGFLKAVHPAFDAAPRVYHLCEDASIIGAVFFVMERRHGLVARTSIPAELEAFENYPRRVSEGFVDCLVKLHRVDLEKNGLMALGKPAGFLERQIRGWAERWARSRTEEIPAMERMVEWLAARMPASQGPTLVHNDYKLDNVMIDAQDPGRIRSGARLGDVGDRRSAGGSGGDVVLLGAADGAGSGGLSDGGPGMVYGGGIDRTLCARDGLRRLAGGLLPGVRDLQAGGGDPADLLPVSRGTNARRAVSKLRRAGEGAGGSGMGDVREGLI